MNREVLVEGALIWAYRNGYANAEAALNKYCEKRGLVWSVDYQNVVSIRYLSAA